MIHYPNLDWYLWRFSFEDMFLICWGFCRCLQKKTPLLVFCFFFNSSLILLTWLFQLVLHIQNTQSLHQSNCNHNCTSMGFFWNIWLQWRWDFWLNVFTSWLKKEGVRYKGRISWLLARHVFQLWKSLIFNVRYCIRNVAWQLQQR